MTATIQATSLFLILFLATAVSQSADVIGTGVVFDRHLEDLRDVAVVGPGFMKVASVIELANQLKTSGPGKPHLLVISAFENSNDASQTLAGKGTTEVTYDGAVERLRSARARGDFRMIRYLAIGDDALMQTVSGTKASQIIVSGRDPTLISEAGRTAKILYVYFNKLPRSIRADGLNPVFLSVYLKADKLPSAEEAERITQHLQRILRHDDLRVDIRTDTWFLENSGVPLWYPFSPGQTPPSYADYRARGEMFCFGDEKGIRCGQTQLPK